MRNTLAFAVLFSLATVVSAQADPQPSFHEYRAYVTGYNTVPEQTDGTPCIAASGDNICGRTDAVACPRSIPLGTYLQIRGATYVCEDRLARKYDSRFDISCDKDMNCPGQVTGWAVIRVFGPERRPSPVVAAAARAFFRTVHRRLVWHGRGHGGRTLL